MSYFLTEHIFLSYYVEGAAIAQEVPAGPSYRRSWYRRS